MQTTIDARDLGGASAAKPKREGPSTNRLPIVHCPVCNERAYSRSSEEITPQQRRLYYRCGNFACSMAWTASLIVEKVISPSGISPDFRPLVLKERKPPGHEYGQAPPLPPLLTYLDNLGSRPA